MLVSINKLSKELDIHPQTLRTWANTGRITAYITAGKHRRFNIEEVKQQVFNFKDYGFKGEKTTILYSRVSTADQKKQLAVQSEKLELFASAKGWKYELLEDTGSGLNYNRKNFKKLMNMIFEGKVERVVVNYKDRLLRYGNEMFEAICLNNNVKIEVINNTEEKTFEQELTEDLISIITVFSAKLYGKRSHKNKAIIDAIKKELK